MTATLELAYPSTAFARDPELSFDGRRVMIGFVFFVADGVVRRLLVFGAAGAFRTERIVVGALTVTATPLGAHSRKRFLTRHYATVIEKRTN
ncbi:MAG: hypothetical protein ACC652_13175 [Acidimicrobiales bacterium]